MSTARYFDAEGRGGPEVDLAPEIFDVQVNVPVMHEVVRAQLAAARQGTHSTKTRGEVRGGGRKPWRQKGLGRARHGSIREPQWTGGGVAHGPKPRDHSMRLNRKMRALALRSALTDRAREGKIIVIDPPEFEEPETKRAVELLETWGALGKVLLVLGRDDDSHLNAAKSFRNLPEVLIANYPTIYEVLSSDTLVFTKPALDELTSSALASRRAASAKGGRGETSLAAGKRRKR
jgi:large subunit ribosomal protein L4